MQPSAQPSRKRRLWIMLAVATALGAVVGVPYYLYARVHVSTDDAFIDGHIVPISPRVAGHVAKVCITDNQWVNKGDVLVELDPRDFEARLAAAEAALETARATRTTQTIGVDLTQITSSAGVDGAEGMVQAAKAAVETARAGVVTAQTQTAQAAAQLAAARAALAQAQAEVPAAEARVDQAQVLLRRLEELVPRKAASHQSLDDASAANRVAKANVVAARERASAQAAAAKQAEAAVATADSALRQAETLVAGRLADLVRAEAQLAAARSAPQQVAQSRSQAVGAAAEAARAEAEVRQAKLNLSYTTIHAPVAGHVTRKSVEPGAYVQVGQALFALVEPNVWVVANFKETQLTHMRPGQPASVRVDTYPGVRFRAHVDSIQRGSGARFSLLPPENATGNYVKVVQRVPVKIVFDEAHIEQYVLGPGMSVVPTVYVGAPGTQDTAQTAAAASHRKP